MNGKSKNRLLVFLFFISIFISYKLAFYKTINLREEYLKIKNESLSTTKINTKLFQLQKQKTHNDSIISKYRNLTDSSFQNNLLQSINSVADENSIKIISFLEPQFFLIDSTKFINYQISVSGSYEHILILLYKIEEEYKYGKLLSVNFKKKKNYRTGEKYLEAYFIIQRIE